MAHLADYLPDSHILKAKKPKLLIKSLYLITTAFKETRKIVSQDWLGETSTEILQKLQRLAFTPTEIEELLDELPVESSDGKKQYTISNVKLEPKQLGSFKLPSSKVKEPNKMSEPTLSLKEWGQKFKRLRENLKLSQEQLRALICPDLKHPFISDVERGNRKFTKPQLEKFCEVTGMKFPETYPCGVSKRASAVVKTSSLVESVKVQESINRDLLIKEVSQIFQSPKLSEQQLIEISNLFKSVVINVLLR